MKKQYYDHKCVKCPGCGWFQPEGKRQSTINPNTVWPEGCGNYGYSFSPDRYPELADDCEGFQSPQYVKFILSKQKKNKK